MSFVKKILTNVSISAISVAGFYYTRKKYYTNKILRSVEQNDPEGYQMIQDAKAINDDKSALERSFVWEDYYGDYSGPDVYNQDKLCRDIEYIYPNLSATVKTTGLLEYTYTIRRRQ